MIRRRLCLLSPLRSRNRHTAVCNLYGFIGRVRYRSATFPRNRGNNRESMPIARNTIIQWPLSVFYYVCNASVPVEQLTISRHSVSLRKGPKRGRRLSLSFFLLLPYPPLSTAFLSLSLFAVLLHLINSPTHTGTRLLGSNYPEFATLSELLSFYIFSLATCSHC